MIVSRVRFWLKNETPNGSVWGYEMILGITHHKTPSSFSPKWDFLTIYYTLARFSLGKGAPIWGDIGSQNVVQPLPINGLKIVSKKYTLSSLSSHLWGPKTGSHFRGFPSCVSALGNPNIHWCIIHSFCIETGLWTVGFWIQGEVSGVISVSPWGLPRWPQAALNRRRSRAPSVLFFIFPSAALHCVMGR